MKKVILSRLNKRYNERLHPLQRYLHLNSIRETLLLSIIMADASLQKRNELYFHGITFFHQHEWNYYAKSISKTPATKCSLCRAKYVFIT